ncbi:hypothetical protein SD70_26520 [Gordoniibacillus kamchatkensis]|uniref:ROK family protein n=1 Tax=Gordoniibacillus kamchatkensis TaxID=1590651 RepID=A0ABR5ACL4_9BACL|nr:ROK family protein [Paenibacillus sp. VKM B-2647]KIL38418.1 hypothetical protein SD70_26520 [Paenibacillus sp. VKM B-2647]
MRQNAHTAGPAGGGAAHEYCGAIDFGGTKTLVGIVNRGGSIVASKRFETDKAGTPQAHFAACSALLRGLLNELELSDKEIAGIGVTVPGLADAGRGVLLHAPYLGWKDVPVAELLRQYWHVPLIAIANDVNACALAESMFGAAPDVRNLLWVTVSTGIGGGLIADGRICEGENGLAGEIGHVVVEWQDGAPCGCGNRGCLEVHASGTAIAAAGRQAYAAADAGSPLRLRFAAESDITAQSLAAAAQDGVEEARRLFRDAGEYLGRALPPPSTCSIPAQSSSAAE